MIKEKNIQFMITSAADSPVKKIIIATIPNTKSPVSKINYIPLV